jgi:hypothetical protein
MIIFHGCVWAWVVEGPPTLPSNISFQKMSKKRNTFLKRKCKGFNLWGEVADTSSPSHLLKFEWREKKYFYVKRGV